MLLLAQTLTSRIGFSLVPGKHSESGGYLLRLRVCEASRIGLSRRIRSERSGSLAPRESIQKALSSLTLPQTYAQKLVLIVISSDRINGLVIDAKVVYASEIRAVWGHACHSVSVEMKDRTTPKVGGDEDKDVVERGEYEQH